jgi:hypothetical protein
VIIGPGPFPTEEIAILKAKVAELEASLEMERQRELLTLQTLSDMAARIDAKHAKLVELAEEVAVKLQAERDRAEALLVAIERVLEAWDPHCGGRAYITEGSLDWARSKLVEAVNQARLDQASKEER